MDFFLPEVYSSGSGELYREKDVFLGHYLKLQKQRFLHCVILELQCRPELLSVDLFVCDDLGNDLDVDLNFSETYDSEEISNYWEEQSAENAIKAAYVSDIREFCDGRTLKRSDLLDENNQPRCSGLDELLNTIESM